MYSPVRKQKASFLGYFIYLRMNSNKQTNQRMKKPIRRIVYILFSPFILFIFLCILIYLPPIQKMLVNTATQYARQATGMNISIGRISLGFPLDLVVHDALAMDRQDTVLWADQLTAKVQLLPLIKSHIELDGLLLSNAQINTGKLIDGISIKGKLGKFYIASHGVALTPETAIINQVRLSDTNLAINLSETADKDTTASEPVKWKFDLRKLDLKQVSLSVSMPEDTLQTGIKIGLASLRDATADLGNMIYSARNMQISGTSFSLDTDNRVPAGKNFDPAHLSLDNIEIRLDSLFYSADKIRAEIRQFALAERSGLSITSAGGKLLADAHTLYVPQLILQTPHSHVEMHAQMDWDATHADRQGKLSARLMADIGMKDIAFLTDSLSADLLHNLPTEPLRLRTGIDGNLQRIQLTSFTLELPAVFRMEAFGSMDNPTDSIRRNGLLKIDLRGKDLHCLNSLMGGIKMPDGLALHSESHLQGPQFKTNMNISSLAHDSIHMEASYHIGKEAYRANLDIRHLDCTNLLPADSIGVITASLQAEGNGMDIFSPHTKSLLEAHVKRLEYGKNDLGGISLHALLKNREATATLATTHPAAHMDASLQSTISHNDIKAELKGTVHNLDLKAFGVTHDSLSPSMNFQARLRTDLNKRHSLQASVTQISLSTPQKTFHTKDLHAGIQLTPDSLRSYVNAGDLTFLFRSSADIDHLTTHINKLTAELSKQWTKGILDQPQLKTLLPETRLRILSGHDNPIANLMAASGVRYDRFNAECTTSPQNGMNCNMYLYGLRTDSLRLDSLSFNVRQDSTRTLLKSRIQALANKKQEAFTIALTGELASSDAHMQIEYLNGKGEKGVDLGLSAALHENGFSLHVLPDHPTLVYRTFHANPDNYIFISHKGRVHANLQLADTLHTGLSLYSSPDSLVSQDLTLDLNKINISEFRRIVPYMPPVAGVISAEAHYIQNNDTMQVATDLNITQLAYDNQPLGDWNMNAVYLPLSTGEHTIDGFMTHNGQEIVSWNGSYLTAGDGRKSDKIQADISLSDFPLYIANAFIPDQMAKLSGSLDGQVAVAGPSERPILNGEITLDSVMVNVPQAALNLKFDNRPVKITDSQILFDRFNIFTRGKSPFTIDGAVDIANLSSPEIDLMMIARNFELVNAKRTKESLVYGKLYVDFSSYLKGNPDNLTMKGNMNILGNSNFTYILKDSPLTVEDRLNETVKFTDFSDTTNVAPLEIPSLSLGGLDVLMTLHIDEAVQARVDLNDNGSNYMLLEGGGDLSFQYKPDGNMLLNGRYSLISGEMKYEMPVIPLKTFHIKSGSYIEWTGDMMNPNMNIKATERLRASVSNESGNSRMVNFDVGVSLTNRLENLGFAFTLEAPDDGAMQNELAGKSAEEKNKLAVTMLVTGIYMDSASSNGKTFDTNSMLNSFLQSEINKITKGFDLSVGMETTDVQGTGTSSTNYNFQFAKRFWNNRFQVIVGGKISSGNDAQQQDESFIDNISLEYRLDNSGTRYIKIFHDKNYESILDGEVIETGAGVVLRKKVSRLGELFIFRSRKRQQQKDRPRPAQARTAAEALPQKQTPDDETSEDNSKQKQ